MTTSIEVAQRLRSALGPLSFAQIGKRTGFHPETVRRYLNGRATSVAFVARVCEEYGIDADWALLGHGLGPEGRSRADQLAEATCGELFAALARHLDERGDSPQSGSVASDSRGHDATTEIKAETTLPPL